ncbi:MAG: hypothetical protein JWN67_3565 [Actinomycetia bacterium]|nr:hypothetical protein [Actinomycetes bacterium]
MTALVNWRDLYARAEAALADVLETAMALLGTPAVGTITRAHVD